MSETERVACGFCGQRADEMHKDHIIPRSRGGGDDARNCLVSCAACNLSKSDRTPSEWRPAGLPSWIYEVERELSDRYKMKPRERRRSATPPARIVPGYSLLKNKVAVCLEHDRQQCRRQADWEVRGVFDGLWGAKCHKCVRHYASDLRRELDEVHGVAHVLAQLCEGTLKRDNETVLRTIARSANVSLEEYLDLARQVLASDDAVRGHLLAMFPQLHLDVWVPTEKVAA